MKIRKGDKVKIIAGKDKGAEGLVERIYIKSDKVLVENLNMFTKHVKPKNNEPGGKVQVSRPIHVSNVMLIDPKLNKPTKVGYKMVDGKKFRFSKKSSDVLGK
ncbi:MAG: large subunit ribosomal protein [Patescibacteria group bacterium]|nr:large subunit ribosomal protein [Patescibacteria group bacterium]